MTSAGDHPLMRSFPQGAIFTFDEDLRYLSAGGFGLADVGLSREMLEGKTIFEVFDPGTSSAIEPLYRAALLGESSTIDVPYEGRIFSQRLAPIFDDELQIVAAMGFTQDMTEAREAEHALRESEERVRLGSKHASIGQALVELDGRWRAVNAAVTDLTGYSEAELRGPTFQDITHPDDLDTDLQLLDRLLAGEIPSYDMEKRYLTASGSTVLVLLSVTLVRSDRGEPQYFIAQIQDITERKAQQAALQDLVEMLSHDLRTPISVVTGYADLLVEEWSTLADDEREGFVRQVSVTGHAVLALLEDTLTVSAVDAKGIDCHPVPVRVDDVDREVVANVPAAAPAADLGHLNAVTALVDRSHLTQILTNLVTNAVKYGSEAFAISSSTDRAETVQVQVSDTGHGVPPEFVPRLFDRFSRSDDARAGHQRGTGLGL